MQRFIGTYVDSDKPGFGAYGKSRLADLTASLTNEIRPKVKQLVRAIPFTNKSAPFRIGDYGSADGATAMTFIRDLIVALKEEHGLDVEIQVIYEDQATNDFNSLFKRLSGIIPDPASYLLELDHVYPLASGISFYEQCVPSDSMHFIMAVAATHYLTKPVEYKQSLFMFPHSSDEEQEEADVQAKRDWESFLLMRSKELKHGGILTVSTTFRSDEPVDGEYSYSLKSFICILTDIWSSFRDSGIITSQEFVNTNIPLYFRSLKQLRAPLEDPSSAVFKSGLRLVSAEVGMIKCAFSNQVEHTEEFAHLLLSAHHTWSKGLFLRALSDSRYQQEKEDIVAQLYNLVEDKYSKLNRNQLSNELPSIHIIIRKH